MHHLIAPSSMIEVARPQSASVGERGRALIIQAEPQPPRYTILTGTWEIRGVDAEGLPWVEPGPLLTASQMAALGRREADTTGTARSAVPVSHARQHREE